MRQEGSPPRGYTRIQRTSISSLPLFAPSEGRFERVSMALFVREYLLEHEPCSRIAQLGAEPYMPPVVLYGLVLEAEVVLDHRPQVPAPLGLARLVDRHAAEVDYPFGELLGVPHLVHCRLLEEFEYGRALKPLSLVVVAHVLDNRRKLRHPVRVERLDYLLLRLVAKLHSHHSHLRMICCIQYHPKLVSWQAIRAC